MQEDVVFSRVCLPFADREAQVADGPLLVVVIVDGVVFVVGVVGAVLGVVIEMVYVWLGDGSGWRGNNGGRCCGVCC